MRKTLQRTFGLLFFALVGVMTGTAQNSFPYSVDFTTAGDLAGWTAVDDSPTKGVTWEYGTGTYSQADANIIGSTCRSGKLWRNEIIDML